MAGPALQACFPPADTDLMLLFAADSTPFFSDYLPTNPFIMQGAQQDAVLGNQGAGSCVC